MKTRVDSFPGTSTGYLTGIRQTDRQFGDLFLSRRSIEVQFELLKDRPPSTKRACGSSFASASMRYPASIFQNRDEVNVQVSPSLLLATITLDTLIDALEMVCC